MAYLLQLLLMWTLLTAAPGTVITYRAVVQPLYEWGWFGVIGTGTDAALWMPAVGAVVPWAIVVMSPPRGPVRPFSVALVAWHAVLFAWFTHGSVTLGSRMTLRGDTFDPDGPGLTSR